MSATVSADTRARMRQAQSSARLRADCPASPSFISRPPHAHNGTLSHPSRGWSLLELLWVSAITLLLTIAAMQALTRIWHEQSAQQRLRDAKWASLRWVNAIGRQWQQQGSLALVPLGAGRVTTLTPALITDISAEAFGAPELHLYYSTPEGPSYEGCLGFRVDTLGDQIHDTLTLRDGVLRCTSHGITQPALDHVVDWKVLWGAEVQGGWQWHERPPPGASSVQAIEVCVVRRVGGEPWRHASGAQDCAGENLSDQSGSHVLVRHVFYAHVQARP